MASVIFFSGPALDGAGDVLEEAHRRGLKLFLSTGSPPHLVEATLDLHGWQPFFSLACGSRPGFDKGQEHIPHIAAWCGLDPVVFAQRALSVGDGQTEMWLGRQYGMPLRVGITSNDQGRRQRLLEAGATHLLPSIAAVGDLLDEVLI